MTRVLFVCAGNICRSPAAEAVFRKMCAAQGVIAVADSAGVGGWHAGEAPDPRMQAAAARRGYDLSGLRARQARPGDFAAFDLVLAMDRANLRGLEAIRPPSGAGLRLFLDFADAGTLDTPDPYYGGPADFERALDLIEAGAAGLVAHLGGASV
jgi:protein-tyrosine phosphatase